MKCTLRAWLICCAALMTAAGTVFAQEEDAAPLVIPVRVVDGHIMVVGFLGNQAGDIQDLSLEVSFQDKGVLTLDENLFEWMGTPDVVRLTLKPGVDLRLPPTETKIESRPERVAMHDRMTRMFSSRLDEHKVKGVLGLGFLRKYHVALDLAAGQLTLSPLDSGLGARGDVVREFSLTDDRVSFPMEYADGHPGVMALGGDVYDTYIDRKVAVALGKPAGDVSPVWLGDAGSIDLSAQLAPRPGNTGAATVLAGVNLMEAFRIEVDWTRSQLAFTRSARPPYPQADLAFFQAEAAGTAAALQSYLEKFPSGRLSPEAATQLLARLMENKDTTDEQYLRAVRWVAETSTPERQMQNCTDAVRKFRAMGGRDELVVRAGLLAQEYGRTTINAQDTYRLHNIIGEAYLNQNKLDQAWEHLLAAAFMPLRATDAFHNFEVNFYLARVYDRMGRKARAYSRYLRALELRSAVQVPPSSADNPMADPEVRRQAIILRDAAAEARAALDRLKKEIPADSLKMLEG